MTAPYRFRKEHVVSPHLSRDGRSEYAVVDRETGEDIGTVYHYITDPGGSWFARAADGRPVEAEVEAGRWGEPFLAEPDAFGGLTFATRKFAADTLVRLLNEESN